MGWSGIISIVVGLLAAIGLPLALRQRKKNGPRRREALCQHLQKMGVRGYALQSGDDREEIGLSRASGQKSEGIIELKDRNVDFINVISIASPYGVQYFLDYLAKNPKVMERRMLKKARLIRRKKPLPWGKVVAVEWKGDICLSQNLNFDYNLEDKLLRSELKDLRGSIWIFPEPKHGYARIRTAYFLPSSEAFEAIDIIARYVKSW